LFHFLYSSFGFWFLVSVFRHLPTTVNDFVLLVKPFFQLFLIHSGITNNYSNLNGNYFLKNCLFIFADYVGWVEKQKKANKIMDL